MNESIKLQLSISHHFTVAEATRTSTGLPNEPTVDELNIIQQTAFYMEQVRKLLNKPIIVNSWFRSEAVNKSVGGVANSQHRLGEAVDFTCPEFGTIEQITDVLKANSAELKYDQLILEPSWVHISFITNPNDPRKVPRQEFLNLQRA